MTEPRPNDPLHGVTLKAIIEHLVERYGWTGLGERIEIRCFTHDPSLQSSLKFLRRTPWARAKVESLYIHSVTHPRSGYRLDTLQNSGEVRALLEVARDTAAAARIRLSFHPDQFVVLNSVKPEVVASSVEEVEWQAELAEVIGADVICLHGGSVAGGMDAAVDRLLAGIARLSERARSRLALENDDRSFPVIDLLPACLATGVPLILDAHHHRVLDGGLSIEEATDWSLATWDDREPHFHVSSPRTAWGQGDPRPHADYVDSGDVPAYWKALGRRLTVDVEAKAKERAVLALLADPGP
jgi:UV DNA damage endonuclease